MIKVIKLPSLTITILTVESAIREHKSKNGNKQLAWENFKHHSMTNLEAKHWLGYYTIIIHLKFPHQNSNTIYIRFFIQFVILKDNVLVDCYLILYITNKIAKIIKLNANNL